MPKSYQQYHTENPLTDEAGSHEAIQDNIRNRQNTHWFWIDNHALMYLPEIGPRAFTVYAVLCRLAGERGHAWPTRKSLQAITGMGWNAVRQSIQRLEKYGLVKTVQRRGQAHTFSSNEYILLEIPEKSTDVQKPLHGNGATETRATETRCTETVQQLRSNLKDLIKEDLEKEKRGLLRNPPSAPSNNSFSVEDFVAAFNCTMPKGIPQCKNLSAKRRANIQKALKQYPERSWWQTVFDNMASSAFLRGEIPSSGHEHFHGSIDWLLQNGKDGTENYVKVNEGRYDDRNGPIADRRSTDMLQSLQRLNGRIARRTQEEEGNGIKRLPGF